MWLAEPRAPDDELDAEPDDDHDFQVVEQILCLLLVVLILDCGEDAQAKAQEDGNEAGEGETNIADSCRHAWHEPFQAGKIKGSNSKQTILLRLNL